MQISRVELYELVWKLPLSKAAPQFGISATALAGVCKKHNIPYPGSLYWTMKSLGRSVEVQQLPATSDDVPTQVVIDPAKPRRAQRHDRPGQPPLPARGTGIASTVLILPTPERSPPPKMTSDVQAKSDEAGQRTAALEVPESLRRPHAIIAGWIADHARRVTDSKRNKSSWGFRIEPLSDLDHRRHRILDTIFKAAERISFKVMSGQYQEVWLESGRNRIDFSLQERIRQVRRPLKADEKRDWNPNQRWRQEKIPTGLLVFKIRTSLGSAIQTEWIDQSEMLLEQQVRDILAALTLAGPLLEEQRLKAEEAERQRRKEEYRHQQEADRRKTERNRWRRFLEFADRWERADRARRFIATIEASTSTDTVRRGGLSHDEWLLWAKERLTAYDPLEAGIESLWENLSGVTSWEYRD